MDQRGRREWQQGRLIREIVVLLSYHKNNFRLNQDAFRLICFIVTYKHLQIFTCTEKRAYSSSNGKVPPHNICVGVLSSWIDGCM
ncbi:hypothetical protein NC653_038768 [Populus alba x Populus x berolinensis]|uniref:Uncharacterized protein n=1 Tax=Populus alba x Populus x berolinensis TaxID=444605 RepID=A0AAD6LHX0_9ROSI|nr:hypothetical protein NC653_038768 [Populus alba x Populus x berolinensis]